MNFFLYKKVVIIFNSSFDVVRLRLDANYRIPIPRETLPLNKKKIRNKIK